MKAIPTILAAAALSGCAAFNYGAAADTSITDKMKPGVTTEAEAEKALGKPIQWVDLGDGRVRVRWEYVMSALIPTYHTLDIVFRDGKLESMDRN